MKLRLPTMTLRELLDATTVLVETAGDALLTATVGHVVSDSRQVRAGDLFVAVRGGKADAIANATAAVSAGCSAVVVDVAPEQAVVQAWGVPVLQVSNARAAIGPLAAARLGHPSKDVQVIGVTGTNGKTTTTILLAQLLCAAGHKAAAIGTVGIWTSDGVRPSNLTTPEAAELQTLLAALRDEGFTHAAIEVSSHALDQHRVAGVRFAAAVWTNLSRDHLDYHGTFDAYAAAKAKLFSDLNKGPLCAFVNADDARASQPWDQGRAQAWSLGAHPAAEHQLGDLKLDRNGLRAVLRSNGQPELPLQAGLVGRHNAENLVAAVLVARRLGVPDAVLVAACPLLVAPRGRLEPVANDKKALIVVDYAHTPDALEKVLQALRPLVGPRGRLGVVFGCGGDRDAGKRPEMGRMAGQLADLIVVTSDNPRSEQPKSIADAIVAGVLQTRAVASPTLSATRTTGPVPVYAVELDRGAAIAKAVAVLKEGDVLCIAGKGHEVTQTTGDEVRPFDDVLVAQLALTGDRVRGDVGQFAGYAFGGMAAAAACRGQLVAGGGGVTTVLCTDSRTVAAGALFVALVGDNFDGALFVGDAVAKGATGVVCAVGRGMPHAAEATKRGAWIVEVADPLLALGALTQAYRARFAAQFIGITGSNGKTTTKELTALACSALGQVLATAGNHNNRIGVPLTIAQLLPRHQVAVVEMGMSVPGEIALLARMAQPRIGIVTSLAEAHLEGLGTIEGIAREKADLLRALPADGVAILPDDEPLLHPIAETLACRVVWFGRHGGEVKLAGPVVASGLESGQPQQTFDADVGGQRVTVVLPGLGVHLAHNALAALAAAWVLGAELQLAAAALSRYKPVGQRMLPARIGPWLVLEDCYNANPRSTETALDTLSSLPGPRVAVLGPMRELGPTEVALHTRVGRHVAANKIDWMFAVAAMGQHYADGAIAAGMDAGRIVRCTDTRHAGEQLLQLAPKPATLLVKGSRGAKMEGVLEVLRAAYTTPAAAQTMTATQLHGEAA